MLMRECYLANDPRTLLSQGGVRALYAGLAFPLAAKGAEQALAFGVNAGALAALRGAHAPWLGEGAAQFAAGAAAGVTVAVAMHPVRLVKTQLQIFKFSDGKAWMALTGSPSPHSDTGGNIFPVN